jgi:hypothetical protein
MRYLLDTNTVIRLPKDTTSVRHSKSMHLHL